MLSFGKFSRTLHRSVELISNLPLHNMNFMIKNLRSFHAAKSPLFIQCSPVLNGEPLKKKKRVDPALLRAKTEKKIKRIMRDIRKLERVAKKKKPIAELEVPKKILRESSRLRPPAVLTEEEIDRRAYLEKEWTIYRREQHINEMSMISQLIKSQERAMDALKEASTTLYEQALQIDLTFIPFKMTGPVQTPPIKDYDFPDGDYNDTTKKYLPIVAPEVKKKKKSGSTRKK